MGMPTLLRMLVWSVFLPGALALSADEAAAQSARARQSTPRAAQAQPAPPAAPRQEPPPAVEPQAPPRSDQPDIEITATVHADSLRFDVVPKDVSVTFSNDTDSVFEFDRGNLPDPVEPGVTYRDVTVRLKISSKLLEKLLQDPAAIQPGIPVPPARAPEEPR